LKLDALTLVGPAPPATQPREAEQWLAILPAVTGELAHRHGRYVHAHVHSGAHRHLLRPRRSEAVGDREHSHRHAGASRAHSHGLVDDSIKRSREGVRAVLLALVALGLTAAAQAVVFVASGSVALLADLIHNFGDASTAVPLGVAFALRSARAERWAGMGVVLAISASACVAGYEAIDRLIDPQEVKALGALAAAGGLGFAGNWVAATIRSRAGRRLDSPALIADGAHARADAYVSLAVVASSAAVTAGLQLADPVIGLAITLVILRIAWQSWGTVHGEHAH
jgi:Co/Zn/Cd efflux system component